MSEITLIPQADPIEVYYKSDFDFILRLLDSDGLDIGFPTFDFKVKIYVPSGYSAPYVATCVGGVCTNCYNDGGMLHIVCDGHRLGVGQLVVEFSANPDNSVYPDGHQLTVAPWQSPIRLVSRQVMPVSGFDISMTAPYALVTAYDLAVHQGYTGTAEEYMQATLGLVQTVAEAQRVVAESAEASATASTAAERAEEIAGRAAQSIESADSSAEAARQAAGDASTAAGNANREAQRAKTAADAIDNPQNLAYNDRNNNFTAPQTITGTLTVNGDIVQSGQTYITDVEHVMTSQAYITVRDGAVGGLGADERAGIKVTNYNGRDTGVMELGADGVLRVGDKGDAQPQLTRVEASQLRDGALLRWDAERMCAVPMRVRIVDAEVTYEDESTATFKVLCSDEGE